MASGLAEELLCPVCLAIFREPHMLSCGHNFCLPCLERCVLLREGACPECRRPFELREALPNRALARLAEKMLPTTTTTTTTTEESLVAAAAAAAACAVGSCRFCDDHVQLFCVQDGALLCEACRDWPQHRGHDFLPVPDAVKVAQGKLEGYLRLLQKYLKEIIEDTAYQQKKIKELQRCTESVLDDISEGFEVLHQVLRQKEHDIKEMIEGLQKRNLEEMKVSLTALKEEACSRREAIATAKAALGTKDQVVLLKGFKELINQIQEDQLGEDENEPLASEGIEETSEGEADGGNAVWDDTEDSDECGVILVDLALKKFKDFLDFEGWKEMLESIKPKEVEAILPPGVSVRGNGLGAATSSAPRPCL